MGTNFYFQDNSNRVHIGKRSAAGLYCWDCGLTLCKGGVEGVHESKWGWLDSCPKCGKKYEKEKLEESSAGRELGFNKSDPKPKTGVSSCSSFSWAMSKEEFEQTLGKIRILDEYGNRHFAKDFEAILTECPIQYFDMVGREFF